MRFALKWVFTKLAVACICVAGFRLQSSQALIHAQSAPSSAGASAVPPGSMMTRIGYKEDQGDLHGEIELQSSDQEHRLVFSFHQKNGELSTLQDQARLVDVLLAHVLHDHPNLGDMQVMFGEGRGSFIPPLDTYLVQSPDWNSRTGLSRHDPFGGFFIRAFNSQKKLHLYKKPFDTMDTRVHSRRSRQN